jgi:uncharacterized membrane protein YdjX (TVP38/TMEM64 family)
VPSRSRLRSPVALAAVALVLLVALAATVVPGTSDAVRALAGGDRESLRDGLAGLGALAPLASVALNVTQAVIAPIPGFIVPYVDGAIFGTWYGAVVTWVGGIAGAMACFGLSRSIARRRVARWCARSRHVEAISTRLERHGGVATMLVRLLPGSPFDLVSYAAGLTAIRTRSFLWGTAAGSAPHALAYAWLGSSLDVPIWAGLAVTPLVGLVYIAAVASARAALRLRRARAA